MKIVQLLATMAFGDAVSNDAAAIDRMLSEMGYKTAIYASNIDPRLPKGAASSWKKMKELHDDDLLIFHGSTGDPVNQKIPTFGGRKMMRYHNITPSVFFRGYSQEAEKLTRVGRRQIQELAGKINYCVAVSDYNRNDLRKMGYECPIDVCPILIPFEDYEKEIKDGSGTRYAPFLVELFARPEVREDLLYLLDGGRNRMYRELYMLLK